MTCIVSYSVFQVSISTNGPQNQIRIKNRETHDGTNTIFMG